MKLLFDLLPVALFFVVFKLAGIYAATAAAIIAGIAQIGWLRLRRRQVDTMQWVSLGIIVLFGGLTLFFQNETFIKWKPTVLYGLFAVSLLIGRFMLGRNLIRALMGRQMQLPDPVWERLNLAWMLFFTLLGALNILVAYRFSTDVWVNFKLFGVLGLTLLFVLLQALYFSRHLPEGK